MKRYSVIIILFLLGIQSIAQDTLPNFTAIKKKDGTAQISWINDYGIVKQITIQRSTDSLRNFASIGTYPNPLARTGGYIDAKAKMIDFYYRIFVQLPEGSFFYTKSKKVIRQEALTIIVPNIPLDTTSGIITKPPVFVPSEYIFTDKKSNVIVILPNAETKNYSILFFDENGKQVLKVPRVKESNLILEKYNFYKSGWYTFEIYLDEKLVERHKFMLSKEKP